jgi:hypothetical protein
MWLVVWQIAVVLRNRGVEEVWSAEYGVRRGVVVLMVWFWMGGDGW